MRTFLIFANFPSSYTCTFKQIRKKGPNPTDMEVLLAGHVCGCRSCDFVVITVQCVLNWSRKFGYFAFIKDLEQVVVLCCYPITVSFRAFFPTPFACTLRTIDLQLLFYFQSHRGRLEMIGTLLQVAHLFAHTTLKASLKQAICSDSDNRDFRIRN